MKANSPKGGFLIAYDPKSDLIGKAQFLKLQGAKVILVETQPVLLAVWDEFESQGAWQAEDNSTVVYDAELTNEDELKQMLDIAPSAHFSTGELLWLCYKSFGRSMPDKLRGSFGFGIWDNQEKCYLTATDHFGLRPVVYQKSTDHFVGASRIKHIMWGGYSDGIIDNDAVFLYLFFQAICTPLTIYEDIKKLEPGNGIIINKNETKQFVYYDISYQPDPSKSEQDWKKLIPEELEKAISRTIGSLPEQRTGCFLSGGTDSSSIVGILTKLLGKSVPTFSIGFDESGYNEMYYADMAVKQYKTRQKEYYVTPDDVLSLISSLPDVYDEPFGNASVIPAFFCAGSAKASGMEVLLGGDGGDEIFGGNERYVRNLVFEKYFRLPEFFRQSILEPVLNILPPSGLFYRAKRYVRRAKIQNPERFYSYSLLMENDLNEIFSKNFITQMNSDAFMEIARHHYKKVSNAHYTDRLLYLDMKFTITDNDIRKVTQMAESVGMRVRYPFLDRDFVDFTTTIPADLKVKWGKGRYLFKKAMEGILPDEIINKPKHGMGLPVDPWFKKNQGLKEFLADHLLYGQPKIFDFVKKEFIQNMFKLHKTAETPFYGNTLWVYLILELWLRHRFENKQI